MHHSSADMDVSDCHNKLYGCMIGAAMEFSFGKMRKRRGMVQEARKTDDFHDVFLPQIVDSGLYISYIRKQFGGLGALDHTSGVGILKLK